MNGRTLTFIFCAFLFSSAALESAIAQAIVREEVRLSQLTLSAFDCSLLTEDSKEAHRLLEVGFTAGRAFLDGINNLTKAERGQVSGKIDPLWQQIWDGKTQSVVAKPPTGSLGQSLWGPTTDFILGRVFSNRAAGPNKASSDDKNSEYRERKCSLVSFHRDYYHDEPSHQRSWHS
jgi:hypothetical protein